MREGKRDEVALPLFVASAAAQAIRGIVLDDATDEPIAGTHVILWGTTGARLGAIETDTSVTSRLLLVPDTGVMDVEFRLTPAPVVMAPVEVRARPRRSWLEAAPYSIS